MLTLRARLVISAYPQLRACAVEQTLALTPIAPPQVCELPFGTKASDTVGGAGGTCVIRGCVPKKLLVCVP